AAACQKHMGSAPTPGPAPGPVDLNPGPPLVAVQVMDAQEAGLLVQAVGAQPVAGMGGTLLFPATLADRLRGAGFNPQQADPGQVLTRVVRAYGVGDAAVGAAGVRVLRKRPQYWLVEGTLDQVRRLQAAGVRLSQPGRNEPLPLEVRVTLPAAGDVQRVNQMGVDIFNAQASGTGAVLTGGAYEWQIEAMTAAGYTVERISTVPATPE
ncbi:MAG TPA: hypothetical protein VFT45_09500, partial [Longimicrobium sp.]|nr:hypothetical protein [Longimicrobium sp.]